MRNKLLVIGFVALVVVALSCATIFGWIAADFGPCRGIVDWAKVGPEQQIEWSLLPFGFILVAVMILMMIVNHRRYITALNLWSQHHTAACDAVIAAAKIAMETAGQELEILKEIEGALAELAHQVRSGKLRAPGGWFQLAKFEGRFMGSHLANRPLMPSELEDAIERASHFATDDLWDKNFQVVARLSYVQEAKSALAEARLSRSVRDLN